MDGGDIKKVQEEFLPTGFEDFLRGDWQIAHR